MTRFLLRRLAAAAAILMVLTVAAFGLTALNPGDPALALARQRFTEPTAADVAEVRLELRLDDPLAVRYLDWLDRATQGDLGTTQQGAPVLGTLLSRFGFTLQIALPALALSLLVAIPVGTVAALKRGSGIDQFSRLGALTGASIPSFALGYLLIIGLAVKVQLLPAAGRGTLGHLVMPVLTLALGAGAGLARLVRSSLLETLGDDYVRTARAKGVSPRSVVVHALRNSLLPVVTVLGLRFGRLLAGAAIVETVFTWPGVGRLAVESIYNHDYPVVAGFVLFTGALLVVSNLLADLAYTRLDPRVRLLGR
ncbi:MAG: ABC transporter permease [Acidimicrobiales bacterium]